MKVRMELHLCTCSSLQEDIHQFFCCPKMLNHMSGATYTNYTYTNKSRTRKKLCTLFIRQPGLARNRRTSLIQHSRQGWRPSLAEDEADMHPTTTNSTCPPFVPWPEVHVFNTFFGQAPNVISYLRQAYLESWSSYWSTTKGNRELNHSALTRWY